MAALLVASQSDIDVTKFVKSEEELRELRDVRSKTMLRSQLRETLPRVVRRRRTAKKNNKVFIVHGHDKKAAKELKTLLVDFGLKPIILHEQAGGSWTVIEKLEKYSNVGYAFVILTPDDVGYCQSEVEHLFRTQKKTHPVLSDIPSFVNVVPSGAVVECFTELVPLMKERARQNVILELGYFMASLKRENVCCLYKGDLEYPSDIRGIVSVQFKKSVREVKETIETELRGAKYELKKRAK